MQAVMVASEVRRTVVSVLYVALLVLLPSSIAMAKALPEGTLILTMVTRVAARAEIFDPGEVALLDLLHANGIADDDLSDGSVALGIVYCCGGNVSKETQLLFYVPPDFRVARGDVVELALGRAPTRKQKKRGDVGAMNRAVRVRDSFDLEAFVSVSGDCRWDPENEALWMRVLYCDWMLGEGWAHRGGLSETWYKKPAAD